MDQGVVDSLVTLVIRAPNQKYNDHTINCCQNWTVEELKAHISDVYPSKPSSKDQRLVYSGKLLLDHFTLKDVLRKQDEYHMLHLVCASRTPPSSPKPPRSRSNKPRESSAGPAPLQNATSPSSGLHSQPPPVESGDRQRTGPFPYQQMYPQLMHGWNQYSAQSAAPTNMPAYINPMTLMWWQQLYARQYYMHYQLLAASSQHLRPDQPSTHSDQPDPLSQRPQADRRGNPEVQMNAQGGEVLNEEELNRDWLDWVYTFSRAAILLSLVYFYSSFSRFVMVVGAMLLVYLHQAGWFPFRPEQQNLLRPPQEAAERHQDIQEMERLMDEGLDDDDDDRGEEGAGGPENQNQNQDQDQDQAAAAAAAVVPEPSLFTSAWSFISTFFTSLVPDGRRQPAN